MIEISPAILINDAYLFEKLVSSYSQAGFKSVDIDIAEQPFVEHETLPLDEVLAKTEYPEMNFGWHLMLSRPGKEVEQIIKYYRGTTHQFRIYVHQEADIGFLKTFDLFALNIGITLKEETQLRELDFYQQFPEVQMMTVPIGSQGGKFDSEAMQKVIDLREMGYVGKISLDGSVNLLTAKQLREYDINRVSVGSFFQKSENLDLDWQKLNLALNL
jgi:pentose-5-phosphate-3-epimerase